MARTTKTTKPTPAPAPEAPRENRYLRASRIIIEVGENIELEELAMKAEMSTATAGHCLEAFKGVKTALGDAGLLKTQPRTPKPEPVEAPVAAK